MKHTKAPWEVGVVRFEKDTCFVVTANKGKVGITLLGNVDVKKKERLANARLIAAAPDLLEALKEVVRISDRKHDAWDKAKAAIAKATA